MMVEASLIKSMTHPSNNFDEKMFNMDEFNILINLICEVMETTRSELLESNKGLNVDARGILITLLISRGYTEAIISNLMGVTQQAVNRLKNIYPFRIRHNLRLRRIYNDLTETLQRNN